MFASFVNLKAINFGGNFDTSNVTNMANMFSNCHSLTNLDLSCFNTSKVTNMIRMFDGCKNLVYLDLSYFHASSATNTTSMFKNCDMLKTLIGSDSKILEVCRDR